VKKTNSLEVAETGADLPRALAEWMDGCRQFSYQFIAKNIDTVIVSDRVYFSAHERSFMDPVIFSV
jgi:hypothetical protein